MQDTSSVCELYWDRAFIPGASDCVACSAAAHLARHSMDRPPRAPRPYYSLIHTPICSKLNHFCLLLFRLCPCSSVTGCENGNMERLEPFPGKSRTACDMRHVWPSKPSNVYVVMPKLGLERGQKDSGIRREGGH